MEKLLILTILTMIRVSQAGDNVCNSSNISFDKTCPKDCSQKPPRIEGDNVTFDCSIGGKKDVDRYRRKYKTKFLPESMIFDAPKVQSVEHYWKTYAENPDELALKFNFSLPKGLTGYQDNWSMPGAVLLYFESIPGPYGDQYYTSCPREKIFEFEFKNGISSYDVLHPRHLMEDCLVGLDGFKEKLAYNITLQTAEGKNASYFTTVTVGKLPVRWNPVIMTHLNETDGTLYIVIEKPPSSFSVQRYDVSLVHGKRGAIRSAEIKVLNTNSTQFVNLTRGQYEIKVKPVCKETCNKAINVETVSCGIDGSMLPEDQFEKGEPHYLEESMHPMKVVAMVTGCVLGILIVLTAAYFIRKRPKCQEIRSGVRPSGLLLHPFDKERGAMRKLKQFISQTFDCTVTDCVDLKCEPEHLTNDTTPDLVENSLTKFKFVLILYYRSCYDSNARSFDSDYYSYCLNTVLRCREERNNIKIVPLQFPFNTSSDLPSAFANTSIQPVNVSDDFEQVYFRIHGVNRSPPNRMNSHMENMSQTVRDIVQAINPIRGTRSARQGESEPLLTGSPGSDIDDKGKVIQHSQDNHRDAERTVGHDIFKQIAEFNKENDSMMGDFDRDSIHIEDEMCSEYTQNEINQQKCNNGNGVDKVKSAESNTKVLVRRHGENGIFEKPKVHTTGKRIQSNMQTFEAEVHHSGENKVMSCPENERPFFHHNAQEPLSLPTDSPYRPNHYNNKINHSNGLNGFTPRLNFNTEHDGIENDLIDDCVHENGLALHISDYQRHPILHGNLHHYPSFQRGGGLDHRGRVRAGNPNHEVNGFLGCQQDNLYGQHNNTPGLRHFNGHGDANRLPISRGMTHQHISHHAYNRFYQPYQPDDMIPRVHNLQETLPKEQTHLKQINHDYANNYHHQRHQADLPHQNETDQYLMSQQTHKKVMHNFQKGQRAASKITFDAVDPPEAELKNSISPVLDIDKKYEEAKRNTADLLKVSSAQSLPTDLSDVTISDAAEYERFSPPEDIDNDIQGNSQDLSHIMDKLIEINQNNM